MYLGKLVLLGVAFMVFGVLYVLSLFVPMAVLLLAYNKFDLQFDVVLYGTCLAWLLVHTLSIVAVLYMNLKSVADEKVGKSLTN